ncbi:MAG: hypothetical protein HY602_01345, partial [Parcubacteria group bacterium]|nr:hypothetical protein [Parcubacteria group bacterium]
MASATKTNYAPWQLKLEDFPKNNPLENQLKFLIRFAILAPSGHNSQPWQFRLEQNKIYLAINKARDLPYSDPKSRQAMISLGCALFNLLTAAKHYQFDCQIESLPAASEDSICVAVNPGTDAASQRNNLISAILTRRTNRSPYKPELPPPYFL